MAANHDLTIRINADAQGAEQRLGDVADAVDEIGGASQTANARLADFTNTLFSLDLLKDLMGEAFGSAEEILKTAEAVKVLQSRLELAVGGLGDSAQAMDDVKAMAKEAGAGLESIGDLYIKTAGAAKSLGLSQEQVASITETVAKGMRLAGASGQQADGAIRQFAQALSGTTLQAEEFNSVNDAAPDFIGRLADALEIARKEFNAYVNDGLVSSADLALVTPLRGVTSPLGALRPDARSGCRCLLNDEPQAGAHSYNLEEFRLQVREAIVGALVLGFTLVHPNLRGLLFSRSWIVSCVIG